MKPFSILILLPFLVSYPVMNCQDALTPGTETVSDTTTMLYNPFQLHIDPMERLLLINIENDPDSLYIGFEPQVFDDDINGKGMLIIAWRADGRVDVYHQPELSPDPLKFDIAGKGLANMVEHALEGAYFEINEFGAHAWFAFEDIHGREIEVNLSEAHPAKRKPFGLLAPMGHSAENPSAMPLVLLHDFYFVRRTHSEISISIAGKIHNPDRLPLPLDFRRMYFARYSPDPLILTLNPAFDGKLTPLKIQPDGHAYTGDTSIKLGGNSTFPEIKNISRSHKHHKVSLDFFPAFPNLENLTNNSMMEGEFKITGHSSIGKVAGKYQVNQQDDVIEIMLTPSEGWIPNEQKWSLRFLYRIAGIFKSWPTTYSWTATLTTDEFGEIHMSSSWKRI